MKLYVNGNLKTEAADTYSTFNNNNEELIIGWMEEVRSTFSLLKGQLDELRLYNRALSEEEIQALYSDTGTIGETIRIEDEHNLAIAQESQNEFPIQLINLGDSEQIISHVWKTEKAWAGSCRQFILTLQDGTVHPAYFQFK